MRRRTMSTRPRAGTGGRRRAVAEDSRGRMAIALAGAGASKRRRVAGALGLAGAALMLAMAGCASTSSNANPAPSASASPSASPSLSPSPSPSPSPSTSPSPSPSPSGPAGTGAGTATGECGEYEQNVRDAIAKWKLQASGTGCDAIEAFQKRFDVRPFDGVAGDDTNEVAQRLLATDIASCGADWGTVACVDLTHQTTWIMRGKELLYGPTVTRTGMPGYATPTGTYTVNWKALKSWSKPYKVWLPYWMSFNNDIGFHETTTYLHNYENGSHGCVNLLHADAVKYYEELAEGATVKVFGHRSGT